MVIYVQYTQAGALFTHAVLKMEQTAAFLIIPTKNFFSPPNQRWIEIFMHTLYFTSFALVLLQLKEYSLKCM